MAYTTVTEGWVPGRTSSPCLLQELDAVAEVQAEEPFFGQWRLALALDDPSVAVCSWRSVVEASRVSLAKQCIGFVSYPPKHQGLFTDARAAGPPPDFETPRTRSRGL